MTSGSMAYEIKPRRAAAVQAFAAMFVLEEARSGSLNGACKREYGQMR